MTAKKTPEASIVLLSYNRLELTKKSVKNILHDLHDVAFELIVVDNRSTDGTRDYLQSLEDPRVRLVLSDENLYFGGGNNLGLDLCRGEYVIFTQNDMTFAPWSIRNLLDLFPLMPEAGCVGIGGGFINSQGIITEISEWCQNPLRRFDYIPVDFVSGCLMVFPRDFLVERRIRFDTRYTLYWEDVDICHQVKKAGRHIYMVHNDLIGTRHLRSGTITPLLGVDERERIRAESEAIYRSKWKSFYREAGNMVQGISYRTFFCGLHLTAPWDVRIPEEIKEHKEDALQVAQAEFLEFQGDFEAAASAYREVIRENPDNFLAYRNLCRLLSKNGDGEEGRSVIDDFKACLNRRPPVVLRKQLYSYIQAALLKIARHYADTGRYTEAHAYYDELQGLAQTTPTIALCEIEKAKMKYLMGRLEEAEQEMKSWLRKNEFLELEPMMFTAAHFYLGEMAYRKNDPSVALDRYHMVLTLDPDHQRAKKRIEQIRRGQTQDGAAK